jgi:hypothetical protein
MGMVCDERDRTLGITMVVLLLLMLAPIHLHAHTPAATTSAAASAAALTGYEKALMALQHDNFTKFWQEYDKLNSDEAATLLSALFTQITPDQIPEQIETIREKARRVPRSIEYPDNWREILFPSQPRAASTRPNKRTNAEPSLVDISPKRARRSPSKPVEVRGLEAAQEPAQPITIRSMEGKEFKLSKQAALNPIVSGLFSTTLDNDKDATGIPLLAVHTAELEKIIPILELIDHCIPKWNSQRALIEINQIPQNVKDSTAAFMQDELPYLIAAANYIDANLLLHMLLLRYVISYHENSPEVFAHKLIQLSGFEADSEKKRRQETAEKEKKSVPPPPIIIPEALWPDIVRYYYLVTNQELEPYLWPMEENPEKQKKLNRAKKWIYLDFDTMEAWGEMTKEWVQEFPKVIESAHMDSVKHLRPLLKLKSSESEKKFVLEMMRDYHADLLVGKTPETLNYLKFVLQHGLDPNYNLPPTIPFLQRAIWQSNVPVVTFLLDAGADPNLVLFGGMNPLSDIANHGNITPEKSEIIKLLIEHGTDYKTTLQHTEPRAKQAVEAWFRKWGKPQTTQPSGPKS